MADTRELGPADQAPDGASTKPCDCTNRLYCQMRQGTLAAGFHCQEGDPDPKAQGEIVGVCARHFELHRRGDRCKEWCPVTSAIPPANHKGPDPEPGDTVLPELTKPISKSRHWERGLEWAMAGERATRKEREDQLRHYKARCESAERKIARLEELNRQCEDLRENAVTAIYPGMRDMRGRTLAEARRCPLGCGLSDAACGRTCEGIPYEVRHESNKGGILPKDGAEFWQKKEPEHRSMGISVPNGNMTVMCACGWSYAGPNSTIEQMMDAYAAHRNDVGANG